MGWGWTTSTWREANRRGIVVTRAPGSNTQAVAEHTMAMILALAKRLPGLSAQVAGGRVAAGERQGAGHQGAAAGVARMRGDRAGGGGAGGGVRDGGGGVHPVRGGGGGGDDAGSGGLLARSDVLSLHLPYSPATRHVVGAAELAVLPAGATVINTARGGLIDEAALLAALESGHLAGAGLDVSRMSRRRGGMRCGGMRR